MIPVFQTITDISNGNCMQACIASLFELPLEDVPHFLSYPNWFNKFYYFITSHGYDHKGYLWNHNAYNNDVNKFVELPNHPGVNGYFFATVYSPKYWEQAYYPPITHAVVIDKDFNIVHPVNRDYIEISKFPDHERIGYNGIIHVNLIDPV